MTRLPVVFVLGLSAWLLCGSVSAQQAPQWPEISKPTPQPELPKWVRVTGDGSTAGMPCEVRTASGQSLGTLQPGSMFVAFNIDARDVTLPIRGRVGRVPRAAVVPLSPEEIQAAQTMRNNEETAAQARADRAARLAEEERIARQAAPPRMQQQIAVARFGAFGGAGRDLAASGSKANPSPSRPTYRDRAAGGSPPNGKSAGGSSPKKCPPSG